MQLRIKKTHPDAILPVYALPDDAGMDIRSVEDVEILSGGIVKINTGIACEIPQGFVGLVWDKSGLSSKHGLTTLAGVIDSGYRGEICITVANLGTETYQVRKGSKIAQILIQPVVRAEVVESTELSSTARGEHGHGSTGVL